MTLEAWALIITILLSGVAAIAGVVAAIAGVCGAYYARRQAQLRTDLEVAEVCLLSPQESEYTRELIATAPVPRPDKVVRVVLRNRGDVTAFQTTGDITFDPPVVQSRLDFLPDGAVLYHDASGQPNGVGLGANGTGIRVRPGSRNIDIPVLVTSSGTAVQVKCLFSTPTGSAGERQVSLEIPADATN